MTVQSLTPLVLGGAVALPHGLPPPPEHLQRVDGGRRLGAVLAQENVLWGPAPQPSEGLLVGAEDLVAPAVDAACLASCPEVAQLLMEDICQAAQHLDSRRRSEVSVLVDLVVRAGTLAGQLLDQIRSFSSLALTVLLEPSKSANAPKSIDDLPFFTR